MNATINPGAASVKKSRLEIVSLTNKTKSPTKNVATIAIPAPRGVGKECELRSLGISRWLFLIARFLVAAVSTKLVATRTGTK
jgi:DNA-binding MurR/RpiR family transcriptional regulator